MATPDATSTDKRAQDRAARESVDQATADAIAAESPQPVPETDRARRARLERDRQAVRDRQAAVEAAVAAENARRLALLEAGEDPNQPPTGED